VGVGVGCVWLGGVGGWQGGGRVYVCVWVCVWCGRVCGCVL